MTAPIRSKHLLSIDDLEVDDVLTLFDTAAEMHDVQRRSVKKLPALRGRTVVNLFFEDSTRTRSSFEIAGKWLSADVINVSGQGIQRQQGREPARHRADGRRMGSTAW
jgi:aspartate carbamoyltransferase catalytic subunit